MTKISSHNGINAPKDNISMACKNSVFLKITKKAICQTFLISAKITLTGKLNFFKSVRDNHSCLCTHEILNLVVHIYVKYWIQLSMYTQNTGFSCPCIQKTHWIQLSMNITHNGCSCQCTHEILESTVHVYIS